MAAEYTSSEGYIRPDEERLPKSEEGDAEIIRIAKARFERAQDAESENRIAGVDDLRFKVSDQWEPSARAMRRDRPCITINKLPTFIHQVTNDQRQNRPSINFSPVGSDAHKKTAQMLQGMLRADERESSADIAYDTGFESAVSNGWGFWRLLTEYVPWKQGDDFNAQRVVWKRIRNPFTVYSDPGRQLPTNEDSMWNFITEKMDREEFKARWPKADPCSWDVTGEGDSYDDDWWGQDWVRVAEYFEVKVEKMRLVELANGHVGYFNDLDPSVKQRILDEPTFLIDRRDAEVRKVCWYKMTGKEILDRRILPGQWIPIVEVVGDETDVEGRVVKAGIIRNAKGPQQIYNYSASANIEVIALQPKAPYIVAEGQIEDYESRWNNANREPFPYLTYKPTSLDDKLVPPPQRSQPPMLSQGWLEIQMTSAQDMMGVTGIRFDSTKQERTSDESGIALQRLNLNQQLGAYHYIDNYARALKFTGRLYLEYIAAVKDTKQKVTTVAEDGSEKVVLLDPNAPASYQISTDEQGKPIEVYNLNKGKFDVAVTIGPNFTTKRHESSQRMIEFLKVLDPQQRALVPDLIAKNQEWAGSDEISRRLANGLPPGTIQPEMSDLSPQMQALLTQQQRQIQQQQGQLQALSAALEDKKADQQIDIEKINKDFEAKNLATMEKWQEALLLSQQAHDDTLLTHIREIVIEGARLASAEKQAAMKPNGEDKSA